MRKWPLILSLLLLLTSCGRIELNELIIVSGLGFDVSPEGMSMSIQLVNPGATAKSKGATESGGAGGAVYTYTISGSSITEIMEKARNMFSRKIYFAHLSVILIGEEFAKSKGLLPILDYLERFYQIRDNVNVFVAKESTAKELFSVYIPIQNMPSLSIARRIDVYGGSMGLQKGVELQDIIRWNYGGYTEPVIPGIKKKIPEADAAQTAVLDDIDGNQKMFEMTGFAFFNDDKLAGWFTPGESRGWAFLGNNVDGFETTVECPGYPDEIIGVKFKETKGKLENLSTDPLSYKATLSAAAEVQEVTCPIALENGAQIKQIEKKAEEKLQREMQQAFQTAVKNNVDMLGLRQLLYENRYSEWKKIKDQWDKKFKMAQLDTSADITIQQTGLRLKSVYEK
ncbi:Ger(x)C family spore germination protein [Metabacillus sp. FJAT-52054]|uniref:Ger(X)C family spore germination protein n=1 Tax=Metabacillus sediminis TaxID=3117746 RepID=A0ABZ2NEN3_9BACI